MQRRTNLLVPCALRGILFLSESNDRVEPHPRRINGIQIAHWLGVRVPHGIQPESGNVQFIAQFGKSGQANVMKRMPSCFVQWAGVAPEESASKKAHARPQGRDVWSDQNQNAARLKDAMHLAQKRKVILQMLDSFGGNHCIETLIRPGHWRIKIHVLKGVSQARCCYKINVRANGVEALRSKRQ